MMQSFYKNWLLVSKITRGFWATSDRQWKVQKVEISWATFLHTLHLHFKLRYYIQNDAKFLQKLTPGCKNHMRNWDNFRQAVESPKSWNLMGYFCPKNTFLELGHYIPKVYLTLLSTTWVKTHQITYVIFETIYKSFFTTQLLCFFFLKHYILSTKVSHQSLNFQTFHCSG